jgi:hypothetical protein
LSLVLVPLLIALLARRMRAFTLKALQIPAFSGAHIARSECALIWLRQIGPSTSSQHLKPSTNLMETPKTTIDEILKLSTGETNRERPHVTVPLYMSVAGAIPLHEACAFVSPAVQKAVAQGTCHLIAVAGGQTNDDTPPKKIQLVLLYGSLHEQDEPDYLTFETFTGEIDLGVLMNGDGTRWLAKNPLPQQEALVKWMAGFLNWNCEIPGLYDLGYAMVEQQASTGK